MHEPARISKEVVANVSSVMPHAKLIYLLRNPIDRMWSEATLYFSMRGYKSIDTVRPDVIRRFFDREAETGDSAYVKNLRCFLE